jgi:homoserine dehydrogenase
MKKPVKLCLLGFGNVGQAFARLLLNKQYELIQNYGIDFQVTGIATGQHGKAINHSGIDLEAALLSAKEGRDLGLHSTITPPVGAIDFITASEADVLFENTPVSYHDGQPAIAHLQAALEKGMHAITANKGPVVHGLETLTALAAKKHRHFYFESAVMDGAPIFGLWRATLPAARLQSFRGVLNSTTNLLLLLMEDGHLFDEAVAHAQSIGIAETDPRGDIDGWDAAVKVAALVTVMMGIPMTPEQVDRTGISDLTPQRIKASISNGLRWKLICSAERAGDRIFASVKPEEISPADPLYTVSGTSSAITLKTDVLGALTLVEEDPGPETTAYGLLADFINAVRG